MAIGADKAIRINAEPKILFLPIKLLIGQGRRFRFNSHGKESIDFNGGQVHGMVGELLDIPSISPVMHLDVNGNIAKISREIEGGKEFLEVKLPMVAGCQEPIAKSENT